MEVEEDDGGIAEGGGAEYRGKGGGSVEGGCKTEPVGHAFCDLLLVCPIRLAYSRSGLIYLRTLYVWL